MFERFTDRMRKVLATANQEAQHFNHEYIDTEHILLGLIKEGNGVGCTSLSCLGVNLKKFEQTIKEYIYSGPDMVIMGKLPQTPGSKKVIELAIKNAKTMKCNYVGTEHLLLGLIDEKNGIAAKIISKTDITRSSIQTEIYKLLEIQIEYSNCRICETFQHCSISQILNTNTKPFKKLFSEIDQGEITEKIYELLSSKCKKYKNEDYRLDFKKRN